MTPLTDADIYRAGECVLAAIGTAAALGHNSPNGMMDYVPRPDDPIAGAVWDAFAATRVGDAWKPERARLVEFAHDRGIVDAIAAAVVR